MAPFCGDPLWDVDLTWNTESPDLTECFQETALVYFPAAVLFLFLPLQALYIRRSRDRDIPWTPLNAARALLTLGLVVVAVVDFAYYIDQGKENATGKLAPPLTVVLNDRSICTFSFLAVNAVYYVSAIVRILMFATALAVSLLCKRHGIVAPGLLFYYWTAMLLCDALVFASAVSKGLGSGAPTPRVTAVVQFTLVATVWFLTCWADPKPRHLQLSGGRKRSLTHSKTHMKTAITEDISDMTPERYASTLSKLTFSWLDSLTLKGYKNILKTEDMYSLMIGNRQVCLLF